MTTTPIAPIRCQSWCEANDGHTEEHDLEDQCCNGVEHRVELHLHEPVKMLGNRHGSQEWTEWQVHDWLTVYATKGFARESAVFVGHGEADGVTLTSSEARQVAQELLVLASLIECKV
jgi:cation transport regulator ChaC